MEDTVLENDVVNESDSDNVLNQAYEPSADDNSQEKLEDNAPETKENIDDTNSSKQKFSNLDDALKSYSELEKKLGQQSNELGELRKQAEENLKLRDELQNIKLAKAQEHGFSTVEEYQTSKEVANFVADEYSKRLGELDYPDDVANLLKSYRQNPSDDILEQIESEFSLSTIKEVERSKSYYEGQLQQALNDEIIKIAETSIKSALESYPDEFQNNTFKRIYSEAFKMCGPTLDTQSLVGMLNEYANEKIKAFCIRNKIDSENINATDEITGLSSSNSNTKGNNGKLLSQMSDDELGKRLQELL